MLSFWVSYNFSPHPQTTQSQMTSKLAPCVKIGRYLGWKLLVRALHMRFYQIVLKNKLT